MHRHFHDDDAAAPFPREPDHLNDRPGDVHMVRDLAFAFSLERSIAVRFEQLEITHITETIRLFGRHANLRHPATQKFQLFPDDAPLFKRREEPHRVK